METWFLVFFIVLIALMVAAICVLYYFQFKPNNESPTQGPQGPGGDQGEIGFPGLRGFQGLSIVGPQGTSTSATMSMEKVQFFFDSGDNATFNIFPDEKSFDCILQRIDNIITIQAANIACFLNGPRVNSFILRATLKTKIATNPIFAFSGYVKTQADETTLYAPLLTSVERVNDFTIAFEFTSNINIWDGSSSFPTMSCFLSCSYNAA